MKSAKLMAAPVPTMLPMLASAQRTMHRLPESKPEIELRAQNAPVSEEILLAYLQ